MKKYIIIVLCFVLFPLSSWGDSTINGVTTPTVNGVTTPTVNGVLCGASSATYCTGAATCTATTPGQCDVLCEDFEGASNCDSDDNPDLDANCRNGFVATVASGDTIDTTTAHSGTLACTDKGSNAMQITNTAASHITNIKYSTSAKDDSFVQVYINYTAESFAANGFGGIVCAQGSSTTTYSVNIKQLASGDKVLSLVYWNNAAANATVDGTTPLSVNTWYRVNIATDKSGGTIVVSLNGVSEISVSDVHTTQRIPDSFFLGNVSNNLAAYTVQYDNWAVDDDTTQGACN